MILSDKIVLVTGVLDTSSIAYRVAELAQEEGAEVILTSFGRAWRLTTRVASRLPKPAEVLEFDAADPSHPAALLEELQSRCDHLDAVLHSMAYGPPDCFAPSMLTATWADVSVALNVSAYSLSALASATVPLMRDGGGSIVGLDFDASKAWPIYNWMGVSKAALESTARYLARELGTCGIRVNLVASGPLKTFSARAMSSAAGLSELWSNRAPLGWSVENSAPVARACVALMSDWFPATTGEIIHVDGGFNGQAV